jgi:hypothetical protein
MFLNKLLTTMRSMSSAKSVEIDFLKIFHANQTKNFPYLKNWKIYQFCVIYFRSVVQLCNVYLGIYILKMLWSSVYWPIWITLPVHDNTLSRTYLRVDSIITYCIKKIFYKWKNNLWIKNYWISKFFCTVLHI